MRRLRRFARRRCAGGVRPAISSTISFHRKHGASPCLVACVCRPEALSSSAPLLDTPRVPPKRGGRSAAPRRSMPSEFLHIPGSMAPRVVGLLRPLDAAQPKAPSITYVHGSATAPRGEGERIIVHIVNDKTANWGGGGFASAVRAAWPAVQADVQQWVTANRGRLRLGEVRVSAVSPTLSVASIVAQHGYGPSATPRIRYAALRAGLALVAERARAANATVHMPRIGTGQAGGSWSIVVDLIRDTLGAADVPVTVYDQPGQHVQHDPQIALPLVRRD